MSWVEGRKKCMGLSLVLNHRWYLDILTRITVFFFFFLFFFLILSKDRVGGDTFLFLLEGCYEFWISIHVMDMEKWKRVGKHCNLSPSPSPNWMFRSRLYYPISWCHSLGRSLTCNFSLNNPLLLFIFPCHFPPLFFISGYKEIRDYLVNPIKQKQHHQQV